MSIDEKSPLAETRRTIPQPLLNRIENEWKQMRSSEPAAPRFEMRFTSGTRN